MPKFHTFARIMALLAGAAGILFHPQAGFGQLLSASTSALGTANNYTTLARGYSAVALNPANLALPGNPSFSLSLAPARIKWGVVPIGLGSISEYEGKKIPLEEKLRWMREIEDAGGLTGNGGAEVTALALSIDRFGFQISTAADIELRLNPDAAELILFGNAGRTGSPKDFRLGDSRIDGFAATTFALSYAHPLKVKVGFPEALFVAGATVKYTIGHALLTARNTESLLTSDPLAVNMKFPVITQHSEVDGINNGHGFGLDVGAAWQWEMWTVGATIQNLIQTFDWDLKNLSYRPGDAFFDEEESSSDFEERPLAEAPASLRDEIDELDFDPRLSTGVSYDVNDKLTLTGDLRHQLGDGLRFDDRTHLGAGAEFRPYGFLSLRGGLALIPDGFQFASGAGLAWGPARLSGAILFQIGEEDATMAMVALSAEGH